MKAYSTTLAVVLLSLVPVLDSFAGVTDFDSIKLIPTSSDTYSLEVCNTSGTRYFYVTAAGVTTCVGAISFSGNVTLGDAGADVLTINSDDVRFTAACAVTFPDTAYFTRLRAGTGSTPAQANATAADGLFIEGVAEIDGTVELDGNVVLGNASSDSVTLGGYFDKLRVGTGSTASLAAATSADGLFVEGGMEVDAEAQFHGAVGLGDSASDAITATGYFDHVRIGTGSSTGHSATAADCLFVEGLAEFDGVVYADGGVETAAAKSVSQGTSVVATDAFIGKRGTGLATPATGMWGIYATDTGVYVKSSTGSTKTVTVW